MSTTGHFTKRDRTRVAVAAHIQPGQTVAGEETKSTAAPEEDTHREGSRGERLTDATLGEDAQETADRFRLTNATLDEDAQEAADRFRGDEKDRMAAPV